jgi:2-polyprenyl-6-methoxyphenol hydroxylase-like FAD-dependent oxidoreductase
MAVVTLATLPRYEDGRVSTVDGRAVVIGGSIAGLLAARVLADGFETVTVLEKDQFSDEPVTRHGVPQGSHVHAMQEAGRATLEDLFPGYGEDLVSAGGLVVDGARDVNFYDEDDFLADGPHQLPVYSATRPLFEHVARQRVAGLDGVHLRSGCQFVDYLVDDDGTTVEGVVVRAERADRERIRADLVVDATGRASRTPTLLEKHGYTSPAVDEVQIDIAYSDILIERPPDDRRVFLVPASSPHTRGGAALPVEDGRWLVNIHGVHGDHPPTDAEGFDAFAATLPVSEITGLLDEHPKVSGEINHYRFPSNVRRRYEDLDRFPDGLVVIGDAIASFNPIYGQGMSVAALEAVALHHALASGDRDSLAIRFFERVQSVVDIAWTMAVGADFGFSETTGPKPRGTGLINRYLSRLTRKAHTDGELRDALFRVIMMEHPPTRLLRPDVAWRVLKPEIHRREHTRRASPKGDPRGRS